MTLLGALLIVVSAMMHAYWNYLIKKSAQKLMFIWLFSLCSTVIYFPVVLVAVVLWGVPHTPESWLFLGGSAGLHSLYILLLGHSYRANDLSIAFPVMKATAILASFFGAVALLNETISTANLIGLSLIVISISYLNFNARRVKTNGTPVHLELPLLTGILIGAYTLWDKVAVSQIGVSVILLDYAGVFTRAAILTPHNADNRENARSEWAQFWPQIIIAGALNPLGYLLFLLALKDVPVSYAVPLRESSIVFTIILGGRLLAERDFEARLVAAMVLICGISISILSTT